MDTVIEDDELGSLIVRVNPRARSLVFRTKSDAVYVSVPPGTTTKEVKRAIEKMCIRDSSFPYWQPGDEDSSH